MLIYATSRYPHRVERFPRWICVQDEFYLLLLEVLHCSTIFKNHDYRKKDSDIRTISEPASSHKKLGMGNE
jgi:hypothetical protein